MEQMGWLIVGLLLAKFYSKEPHGAVWNQRQDGEDHFGQPGVLQLGTW